MPNFLSLADCPKSGPKVALDNEEAAIKGRKVGKRMLASIDNAFKTLLEEQATKLSFDPSRATVAQIRILWWGCRHSTQVQEMIRRPVFQAARDEGLVVDDEEATDTDPLLWNEKGEVMEWSAKTSQDGPAEGKEGEKEVAADDESAAVIGSDMEEDAEGTEAK